MKNVDESSAKPAHKGGKAIKITKENTRRKIVKRINSFFAGILSFALIFALYAKPTVAAYNISTQQETYASLLYCDMTMPLMSDVSSKQIAEKYSAQIATITGDSQRICGQITWETLEQIKVYIKSHNSLDMSYCSLLSDIAIAATEQKLTLAEDDIIKECLGEFSNTRDYGGFEIRNKTVTNLTSFKPLKGNVKKYLQTNSSESSSLSVTIGVGDVIDGYSMTASTSASTSYSMNGPSANTWLHSGVAVATHTAVYGVLNGIVQRITFDLVEASTGNVISHETIIKVEESTKYASNYTLFVSLGNPTYVDHARYNQTFAFATQSAFERNAQNSPDYFIN